MLKPEIESKLYELGCIYNTFQLNELVAYLREQLGIIITILPVSAYDDGNRFIGYKFAVFKIEHGRFIDDVTDLNQNQNCNFNEVLIAGIEFAVRRYFIK